MKTEKNARTDGRTDTTSYRDATAHLKTRLEVQHKPNKKFSPQRDERTAGQTDGRKDGWTDGQTDG